MTALALRLRAALDWRALPDRHPAQLALVLVLFVPLIYGLISGRMGFSHWAMFSLAGLAMGMMLFLMASGLTLVFGLMNVLNLAHGAFIGIGGIVAFTVLTRGMPELFYNPSPWISLAALGGAVLVAAVIGAGLGWLFEWVVIRGVYGDPLKEILITAGAGLVIVEVLNAINSDLTGGTMMAVPKPASIGGSFLLGDIPLERYRVLVAAVGIGVFLLMDTVLRKTKVGLLIRAGVERREMVEVMGYRIGLLFIGTLMAGTALAAMGGVLWAVYQNNVVTSMGNDLQTLAIVVIIVGGMGSIPGCFVGALLLGLATNYLNYLWPSIGQLTPLLLLLIVLLWRPQGLIPVFRQ